MTQRGLLSQWPRTVLGTVILYGIAAPRVAPAQLKDERAQVTTLGSTAPAQVPLAPNAPGTEPNAPNEPRTSGVDDLALSHQPLAEIHAQALAQLRAGKSTRAMELMRLLVERDPLSCEYVTDLGFVLLRQGKWVEAETHFRRAIRLDESRPYAYTHLVDSILKQPNRWEKREELFSILQDGHGKNRERASTRIQIELLLARAQFEFGLLGKAKLQVNAIREALKDSTLSPKDFTAGQRRQLEELTRLLSLDTRARNLQDWPEPEVMAADRARLREAAAQLKTTKPGTVQQTLQLLRDHYPAWREPRRLLADLLTTQGRYDEAVSELSVLTRLAPSDPSSHKQLGLLLAAHGGTLSAARADEALSVALSLEPEWLDLQELRDTLKARKVTFGRANGHIKKARRPTPNAIRLHDEALEILQADTPDTPAARSLVEQSLRESPAYAAAAATLFSLSRGVHKPTVNAFWDDPEGLFGLYQELRRLEGPPPAELLQGYLDRSIELGSHEALFARALQHQRQGERRAAIDDLARYLALESEPEKLDAARSLRFELSQKDAAADWDNIDPELRARVRLQEDDPEGALSLLGAPCQNQQPTRRLLALGMVYERLRQDQSALGCYELGLLAQGPDPIAKTIATRAARLLSRTSPQWLHAPVALRLSSIAAHEPAAYFAMSRRAQSLGDRNQARSLLERYLATASPSDAFVASAKTQLEAFRSEDFRQIEKARKRRDTYLWAIGLFGLTLLFAVYRRWFYGSTLMGALSRRPQLFPEVSRIVSELRHDVLKHRISALGLLSRNQVTCAELLPAIVEPTRTSAVVADAYGTLQRATRSYGLVLARLAREPYFGRLHRDLKRVEQLLTLAAADPSGSTDRRIIPELLQIDQRFCDVHAKNLGRLLGHGPSCELDAATLQRWSVAIASEQGAAQKGQVTPALSMSDLRLRFPLDEQALQLIFANLLRNAQAAVSGQPGGAIVVILRKSQDFTGQSLVQLLVGDNAPATLTLGDIEGRDPSRGLGIVRDTTRHWRGRLVISAGDAPYTKYVGAQFSQ